MKKITIGELYGIMSAYNKEHPENQDTAKLYGVIVYKQSNWNKPFSEEARSYKVANCNRAFQEGKISNALSGDCLDGTDLGVRLDWYNWESEYCYMLD